jgi:hypothetical protein
MAIQPLNKNWGVNNKNINYVGKDFAALKQNLIDFTKTYFPNTYSDFNDASPGMVFIEQAAAIGDVLSFYQDTQLKESMLAYATERKNVMSLAQAMGYKPKVTTPAVTNLTVYQLVPSNGQIGSLNAPDSDMYLKISAGLQVTSTSNSNVSFITTDAVDFGNPIGREIDVYQRDAATGSPTQYLIIKTVQAISARKVSTSISFADDTDYPTALLSDTNIIQIQSIVDSNGNTYYEVPYLAQESVFVEQPNTSVNAGADLYNSSSVVPYLLEVQTAPYRFSVLVNTDNTMTLQFGSGDVRLPDEIILPNSKNVGLGLSNSIQRLNQGIDPSNFLKTNTFGIAPINTTLTITYLVGGGVQSNVNSGDLTTISNINFDDNLLSIAANKLAAYQQTKATIAVENLEPAIGGRDSESIDEIRQNALANFSSQNRAVTRQDYIVRALSMPERYGSIAKVYVAQDSEIDNTSPASILSSPSNIAEFTQLVTNLQGSSQSDIQKELTKYISKKKNDVNQINNPLAINMYVLGYNSNKNLTNLNQAIKQNLKTYLSDYRLLTDAINLLDGFIVNIGIDFEVTCYSNYNKSEVIANCLTALQSYFNIDKWTFNKPINISEIELTLANIDGVMSVPSVVISNLCAGDGTYSPNRYNISQATQGKIVYPSLDPCIFEVKYPTKDIKGRAL